MRGRGEGERGRLATHGVVHSGQRGLGAVSRREMAPSPPPVDWVGEGRVVGGTLEGGGTTRGWWGYYARVVGGGAATTGRLVEESPPRARPLYREEKSNQPTMHHPPPPPQRANKRITSLYPAGVGTAPGAATAPGEAATPLLAGGGGAVVRRGRDGPERAVEGPVLGHPSPPFSVSSPSALYLTWLSSSPYFRQRYGRGGHSGQPAGRLPMRLSGGSNAAEDTSGRGEGGRGNAPTGDCDLTPLRPRRFFPLGHPLRHLDARRGHHALPPHPRSLPPPHPRPTLPSPFPLDNLSTPTPPHS